MKNEIYFNPVGPGSFGTNMTIDKSTKYGIEIQNKHSFNKTFSAFINYTYTRAVIDEELEDLNCHDNCKGNDMPGVAAHNMTFALHYTPTQKLQLH